MKETEQLKKLMESIDTAYAPVEEAAINVGDPDPMTGELETMPEGTMAIDWRASPEVVIDTINDNLGGYGMMLKMFNDGSDTLKVAIVRVDY